MASPRHKSQIAENKNNNNIEEHNCGCFKGVSAVLRILSRRISSGMPAFGMHISSDWKRIGGLEDDWTRTGGLDEVGASIEF